MEECAVSVFVHLGLSILSRGPATYLKYNVLFLSEPSKAADGITLNQRFCRFLLCKKKFPNVFSRVVGPVTVTQTSPSNREKLILSHHKEELAAAESHLK